MTNNCHFARLFAGSAKVWRVIAGGPTKERQQQQQQKKNEIIKKAVRFQLCARKHIDDDSITEGLMVGAQNG